MLAPGEITPGIMASEFQQRRERLCAMMPPNSLVIVPASSLSYMAGVIPYPYRQDPDFMYLTGLNQRAVAVLRPGSAGVDFTLFLDPANHEVDRWDGARLDAEAAVQVFGATAVQPSRELARMLLAAAASAPAIFYDADRLTSHHRASVSAALRDVDGERVQPLRPLTHSLRVRKSRAEADLLRRAAQTTAGALRRCMAVSEPGITEHQLAAVFEYECRVRGAERMAFPCVTAGGADALTTHYSRNDKRLVGSQMVKMDVGCELHHYISDVTRTWPIGGRYSQAQRDVYDIVRNAHTKCVAVCRPGVSIQQLHQLSVRLICEGLSDLRLPNVGSLEDLVAGRYQEFYWHSLGHYIGLDTHDTALMSYDRPLQPGHVITIEPGLYIPDDAKYGALRGLGVRIEDDVLLTPDGCEVLSRFAPSAPHEVEALVGSDAGAVACLGGADRDAWGRPRR